MPVEVEKIVEVEVEKIVEVPVDNDEYINELLSKIEVLEKQLSEDTTKQTILELEDKIKLLQDELELERNRNKKPREKIKPKKENKGKGWNRIRWISKDEREDKDIYEE